MDDAYIFYNEESRSIIGLPKYAKKLRDLEKDVISFLETMGGVEIILPKLIKKHDCVNLIKCNPRFSDEWNNEQLSVYTSDGNFKGYLAHWQCEPIYDNATTIFRYIEQKDGIKIIFDRSGYSYRNEPENNFYRPNEFLRLEIFIIGSSEKVHKSIEKVLLYIVSFFPDKVAKIKDKPNESFNGVEKVRDVIVYDDNQEIEICGSHIHYRTFENILKTALPSETISACCGISLTRIVNFLIKNSD